MRQPSSVLRYLVILFALMFTARAHADDRGEARTHYQAGVKFYSGGDYRAAIREFSAAQQLVPADLNNYNLALCYDKLGDADPAIQYYRAFLDRQPNTDKRAEIEASVNRLEAASRSAASKKADEAKKLEDAKPVGPVLGPTMGPGAPGPTLAPAPSVGPAQPVLGPSPPPSAADRRAGAGAGVAVGGSIGTPSSAAPVPTGDAQLDRVNAINIDQVRDQRMGGASSGMSANPNGPRRTGPAVAANDQGQPLADNGQPPPNVANAPNAATTQPQPPEATKRETPLYKKWWFWGIVAVSGYVVYSLATDSSKAQTNSRGLNSAAPGGMTLLRW
jgi:Tetratricopeptide repeat